MIFTKGDHQSAKFQIFNCSGEISPNLYFYRLLLLKVYKISAKKLKMSHVSWHWRIMQNLKKSQFVVYKMTRIWWILIQALKSQKLALNLSFLCKGGVMSHDNEESCKIWRKTGLWFGKWHEASGKFSSEHLKVSELVFSWDHFAQNRKCTS